jgi:CrcB protein
VILQTLLAVAAGGAAGASARYMVSAALLRLMGDAFPYGTLFVNVVGSFLMGVLIETLALKVNIPRDVQALLAPGFLGGFTTFSTFSLDAVTLFERQAYAAAAAYVLGSVILSITALVIGMVLVRAVVALLP